MADQALRPTADNVVRRALSATHPITDIDRFKARLEALPPELYEPIASLVCTLDSSTVQSFPNHTFILNDPDSTLEITHINAHYRPPARLQLNKIIRADFAAKYYAANRIFLFETVNDLEKWLVSLRHDSIIFPLLRKIKMRVIRAKGETRWPGPTPAEMPAFAKRIRIEDEARAEARARMMFLRVWFDAEQARDRAERKLLRQSIRTMALDYVPPLHLVSKQDSEAVENEQPAVGT